MVRGVGGGMEGRMEGEDVKPDVIGDLLLCGHC